MFSVKIEVSDKHKEGPSQPESSSETKEDLSPESLDFSIGNQRVEHVTGVIHLYKKTSIDATTVSSQVCVLCVPSDVGVQEFCHFCGSYLKLIKEMRFLRKENTRDTVYMVHLRFTDETSAKKFVDEYNGRPFCSLEKEIVWKLVYVNRVEFTNQPGPSSGETELPTCPVCLERLDENISGLVITVCNHVFHNECLMKWGDTSCPVCRHCMQASAKSLCNDCGAEEDLWICLICGHVGCGRYKSKHAIDHWKDTQHCYALELESQRVWDYVGDGYVHRLVQSKSDGKLVEVTAPGGCSASHGGCSGEGRLNKEDCEYDEAIVASKIDAIAFEYNHLLTAQLESQRLYFEGLLCQSRMEAEAKMKSMSDEFSESAQTIEELRKELKEATKQRKTATKKMNDLNERVERAEKEKEFLMQLNETLIANQKDWKEKTTKLEADLESTKKESAAKIQDLEEQNRDLIVFIEAQKAVNEEGDLQGGSLVAQENQESGKKPVRRRRGRK